MSDFKCLRCGACCRWKGAVKLEDAEVDAIAAYLQMPVAEFLEAHTRLTPDRKHLSLCEKANGECEYLTVAPDATAARTVGVGTPHLCNAPAADRQ